jgi:hypothetical protein
LLQRFHTIRKYPPATLRSLPESDDEDVSIEGKSVQFVTYRQNLTDGKTLIVLQAFVSTLNLPTFISLSGIGHILAEGFIIDSAGAVQDAPEELLWEYR